LIDRCVILFVISLTICFYKFVSFDLGDSDDGDYNNEHNNNRNNIAANHETTRYYHSNYQSYHDRNITTATTSTTSSYNNNNIIGSFDLMNHATTTHATGAISNATSQHHIQSQNKHSLLHHQQQQQRIKYPFFLTFLYDLFNEAFILIIQFLLTILLILIIMLLLNHQPTLDRVMAIVTMTTDVSSQIYRYSRISFHSCYDSLVMFIDSIYTLPISLRFLIILFTVFMMLF